MSISLNTLTLPLVGRATESIYGMTMGLHSTLSGSAAAGPNPSPNSNGHLPKAPPGATEPVNEITGYVVWGVIILFGLALIIGLGAIVAGRIFSMPHASKVGVISLVVVFVAAVAYLVLPGMLDGIPGNGCV